MEVKRIYIEPFIPTDVALPVHKTWAIVIKRRSRLSEYTKDDTDINFVFPEYIWWVTSDFFRELLKDVLWESRDFKNFKLSITVEGGRNLKVYFDDAIEQIIQSNSWKRKQLRS